MPKKIPNSPLGHYFTTAEAAERARLTQTHIALLLRKKELRGFKVGPRFWLVEKDSLAEYLEIEHKRGAKPKTNTAE